MKAYEEVKATEVPLKPVKLTLSGTTLPRETGNMNSVYRQLRIQQARIEDLEKVVSDHRLALQRIERKVYRDGANDTLIKTSKLDKIVSEFPPEKSDNGEKFAAIY